MTISGATSDCRYSLLAIFKFLKLGFKTAFFQRPNTAIPDITPVQLLAMVVLAELIVILFERFDIKGPATFYPNSLMWGWTYIVISLWLCWFLVRRSAESPLRISVINLFAIVIAQGLIIDTISNIAYLPIIHGSELIGSSIHWALYGALVIWGASAFIYLLIRQTRASRKDAVLAALVTIAMYFLAYNFQKPLYWYGDRSETESSQVYLELTQAGIEEQLKVAEKQRNSLKPGREGKVELFSISFAPYASEDVFLNESIMINNLVLNRFDAGGHNQELINHVKTHLDKPWATLENLERAIYESAQKMNKDEDVLFIYLTSHGSKDFKLSASHWPLKIGELTPQTLNLWLDKAGIKNRVIAVSACYSGGWIGVLKNDHTLVMSAADKDHTSYGCGRKSELTYFGNAVFNEAMRHTLSFEKAFQRAVPVIKNREEEAKKDDGFSNPQIFVGNGIRPILNELEKHLEASETAAN